MGKTENKKHERKLYKKDEVKKERKKRVWVKGKRARKKEAEENNFKL
jgi:hypothetical protein